MATIVKLGGQAYYDYQLRSPFSPDEVIEPEGPGWLRYLLGDDFFCDVVAVSLIGSPDADAGLANVQDLPQLQTVHLQQSKVTVAGLVKLNQLTKLEMIDLTGTNVTDAEAFAIQKALPKCLVNR